MDALINYFAEHISGSVGAVIFLTILCTIISIKYLYKLWVWLYHKFKKPQEQKDKAQDERIKDVETRLDVIEEEKLPARVTELEKLKPKGRKKKR